MEDKVILAENLKIYNSVKYGDVIWVHRAFYTKEKVEEISSGHKEGPFIVIGHKNGNIIGLYATSVEPKNEIMKSCTLHIPREESSETGLNKDTYIDVHRVMNVLPKQFISYKGSLSEEDKQKLSKKIDVLRKKGFHVLDYIRVPEVPTEKGDLVWYENSFYLILERRKKSFIATELKESPTEKFSIKIKASGVSYYFNPYSIVGIRKERHPVRIGFVESNEDLNTVNKMVDRINELSEQVKTRKGSIITYKHSVFYIYGELKDNWQAFRIYQELIPDFASFKVGEETYYTDFQELTEIFKAVVIHRAINQASEAEMENIKKVKKAYNSKSKYRYGTTEFNPGDVIIDKDTRTQEYIAILPYTDKIIVIKKEDMYTRDYHLLEKDYEGFSLKGSINNMLLRDIMVEIQNIALSKHTANEIKSLIKIIESKIGHY